MHHRASACRAALTAGPGPTSAGQARPAGTPLATDAPGLASAGRRAGPRIVAIGASTGGVEALMTVLAGLPATCPPTVVVQHMRARFIGGFVERLDRACSATVREATSDAPLRPGTIYVATGDEAHLVVTGSSAPRCALRPAGLISGHRPSVDALFHSLAPIAHRVVGVLLTGMGRDGAEGLLALRRGGGRTICQDRETCVVHGMPRAAVELGAADIELPLDRIAPAILKAARRSPA